MADQHGPIPVPARITLALDSIGAEGPWVDRALGGEEPMVDRWEAGETVPTRAQIEALAKLTGFLPGWFYRPADEIDGVTFFICDGRRHVENALMVIRSRVAWDGVLHVEELTPPRLPYRPRAADSVPISPTSPGRIDRRRPVCDGEEDPDVPGHCGSCRLPMRNARHT